LGFFLKTQPICQILPWNIFDLTTEPSAKSYREQEKNTCHPTNVVIRKGIKEKATNVKFETQMKISSGSNQIVARNKPSSAVLAGHLGLPPSIILQSQDRQDISLRERQFFRNSCLVHVHCSGYYHTSASGHVYRIERKLTELENWSSVLGELSLSSRALAAYTSTQLLLLLLLLLWRRLLLLWGSSTR
jgi:hypothetical protein